MTTSGHPSRAPAVVWLSGPLAGLLFGASLIGFAALRTDGYTHATKAVSELGAIGAPYATAFNILGLIAPGALIFVLACGLFGLARRTGPVLLMGSGLFMALSGFAPVDMSDLRAPVSVFHAIGAMGTGVTWLAALFLLGPMFKSFGLPIWARLTPWFSLFMAVSTLWQVVFQATGLVMPGWGQRIGFAGLFVWAAITGILLLRRRQGDDETVRATEQIRY